MGLNLFFLIASAIVTVAAVKYQVMPGIEIICERLRLTSKTKGQIIGYATSTPEFVIVLYSAFAGVFDAGFWNIASSNIINLALFLLAIIVYRQHRELFNARFVDEIAFGFVSAAIPLALFKFNVGLSIGVSIGLFGLFVVYRIIDLALNPTVSLENEKTSISGPLTNGLLFLVLGICVILVAGHFLGQSAATLIQEMKIPTWLVGWILGFITSVPEMTSFFEIYRIEKKRKQAHLLHDTQQALDALVSSNMCNLGIILPAGGLIYLIIIS